MKNESNSLRAVLFALGANLSIRSLAYTIIQVADNSVF